MNKKSLLAALAMVCAGAVHGQTVDTLYVTGADGKTVNTVSVAQVTEITFPQTGGIVINLAAPAQPVSLGEAEFGALWFVAPDTESVVDIAVEASVDGKTAIYDVNGRLAGNDVNRLAPGTYIISNGNKSVKIIKR